MNFPIFRGVQGALSCLFTKIALPPMIQIGEIRGIHCICRQFAPTVSIASNQNIFKPMNFLTPILPQFNQVCGMKQRGQLQLRCKGCYFVTRQGRLYVNCSLKPRHKQMQMIKSFKKRRILTFAQQKKIREW